MQNTFNETRAFPSEISAEVNAMLPELTKGQAHPPSDTFQIQIRGESIEIPYRVYYLEVQLLKCAKSTTRAGIAALCLGTRHHNGYLRQKCLVNLLTRETELAVPFVMQLLGEYVVEITQTIEYALSSINPTLYQNYFAENARNVDRIERPAISYWNEYYRRQYPKMSEYPALRAIAKLRNIAGKRLL